MNPKLPRPLIVRSPLDCVRAPATTSHSNDVEWKFRPATWNWSSVWPVGSDCHFLYFATKPKLAFPVRLGSGV